MPIDHVPFLDLRRQGPEMDAALEDAFRRVLRSGHYILGPEVDAFETECAALIGARHAIGVSSGTDALIVALMALGVGAGDEVICPTYTFFATVGAVARLGARPVLVDICPRCMNLDAAAVERAVTARTKAIIPVHLFGQCAEMQPIVELARARNIHVVEDAAQAIGAAYGSRPAGTLGAFGCFSFFPSKNLGALGDAGLVTTEDDALAQRARILRAHGAHPKYFHEVVGGNFRIDALQAALLRVKLPALEKATAARRKNAALYTRLFSDAGIGELVPAPCQTSHVRNQFVVRAPGKRDALRAHLASRKVGTEIYYPVPMHLQRCFADLGHHEGDFPVAEAAARDSLALPVFGELSEDEIRYVANAVVEFFRA